MGRPPKGEQRPKVLSRLQRQGSMTLEEMPELPKACDIGVKSQPGRVWRDGPATSSPTTTAGFPISCLLTSASVHDSRRPSRWRADGPAGHHLRLRMDSAYDAPEIRAFSEKLGHVPIIHQSPQATELAQRCIGHLSPKARRYGSTTVERVRSAQGGVWRAAGDARPWQGDVPPDVRHSCTDGGTVDATDPLRGPPQIPDKAG